MDMGRIWRAAGSPCESGHKGPSFQPQKCCVETRRVVALCGWCVHWFHGCQQLDIDIKREGWSVAHGLSSHVHLDVAANCLHHWHLEDVTLICAHTTSKHVFTLVENREREREAGVPNTTLGAARVLDAKTGGMERTMGTALPNIHTASR